MKKPTSPPASIAPGADDYVDLVKEFRAHLHLAITAKQLAHTKKLKDLPGPRTTAYCRTLAAAPDNLLAKELAAPIWAVIEYISDVANVCEATLRCQDEKGVELHESARRVLGQVDFALGLTLRWLLPVVRFRAEATEDADLLCEWACTLTDRAAEAERMVRRYHERIPDPREADGSVAQGSFAEAFAWDVYQRVATLDHLANDFPEQVRYAARGMHAWPMLVHRHTHNRRRFEELAKRLELGAEYPIDATEGARWRPDTPLVQYLDPMIHRLHRLRCDLDGYEARSQEQEADMVRRMWWQWPEERPQEEVVQLLCAALRLPPLTKRTAVQWAEKVVVPLILAKDARDWKNCQLPVLQCIAKQRGVKSRATFKSRLLAAVTATLRRLARPT